MASRLASSEAPPASFPSAAITLAPAAAHPPALLCLSHLRWDFVTQRPQHLMSRFARDRRVFFIEEPVLLPDGEPAPRLALGTRPEGVQVAVPHLPPGLSSEQTEQALAALLRGLLREQAIANYVLWYSTPMALAWTADLAPAAPAAIVYDCMDELSLFKGAPRELLPREERLLEAADLVFTGGASLYEAKRDRHPERPPLPQQHRRRALRPRPRAGARSRGSRAAGPGRPAAAAARLLRRDRRAPRHRPARRARRPAPRLADRAGRPGGEDRPRRPAARGRTSTTSARRTTPSCRPTSPAGTSRLLPFALNEATRFISPTKTPEYLAGGRPVVSTPIRDVVRPYGDEGLVEIAADAAGFAAAAERCLAQTRDHPAHQRWLRRVDEFLAGGSWDETQRRMADLISAVVSARRADR